MEQENQDLGSRTEDKFPFRYLSETILSPAVIGSAKIIAAVIGSDFSLELDSDHLLELYLTLSGVADMGEMLYRTYIKDEYGAKDGVLKKGIPFSFFERHLLYDLPKGAYNTIKNLVKKE